MKATAVTELPDEGDWIYEIKWDGYRALGLKHHDDVRLPRLALTATLISPAAVNPSITPDPQLRPPSAK